MHEHHTKNGFRNPGFPAGTRRRLGSLARWLLGLGADEPPAVDPARVPETPPLCTAPNRALIAAPDERRLTLTWIGHATFLIQAAGVNLLTDPVFSERASPFPRIGPKRHTPPGLELAALPRIDAVLISHNHYDHLDRASVQALAERWGHARFFVPRGLSRWLHRAGIERVSEHDWWESASCASLRVHCVPAQHFSGRGLHDRNRTLWCGWVIEAGQGRILFAGDTGYAPVFSDIGRRFAPLRLALLPIGAYRPRWFMAPVHVDPPEAVRIHGDLGVHQSIAMHWGTFRLTDEPLAEPPLYLAQARCEAGISAQAFDVMSIGETRVLDWEFANHRHDPPGAVAGDAATCSTPAPDSAIRRP